jgi:hypothetical protein
MEMLLCVALLTDLETAMGRLSADCLNAKSKRSTWCRKS